MGGYYDGIEIEDMSFDLVKKVDYEDYEDEEDDGELEGSSQDDEDEGEGNSHSTSASKATGLTEAIPNLGLDHETVEPRGTKEDTLRATLTASNEYDGYS
ncbi:hypothetical protein FRB94_012436 [Tulasnella sp. JGI-2019a]|nr:hypothetical protein FRB94_012436 [Tulasnella sp. JGI-2019a]KAG9033170.1 hypothetical protein FRB95_000512 [Tulasnella sp. JGI-2019a]